MLSVGRCFIAPLVRNLSSAIGTTSSLSLQLQYVRPVIVQLSRSLSTNDDLRTIRFFCGDAVHEGTGKIGSSLLDVVVDNDLPLDGFGACEGTLACCTCHVVLEKEHFERQDKVNPAGEDELDLLDLAPELDDRSRLGCQIKIEREDPKVVDVQVPTATRDARLL